MRTPEIGETVITPDGTEATVTDILQVMTGKRGRPPFLAVCALHGAKGRPTKRVKEYRPAELRSA